VRYSRPDQIVRRDQWTSKVSDDLPVGTLQYTTSVINTPSGVRNDINMARDRVMSIVLNPIRREDSVVLEEIRVNQPDISNSQLVLLGTSKQMLVIDSLEKYKRLLFVSGFRDKTFSIEAIL
jgi:hypothetical protein